MTGGRRHERVADAIDELAALRSTDPAARDAIDAVKLTRLTLETWWSEPPEEAAPRRGA